MMFNNYKHYDKRPFFVEVNQFQGGENFQRVSIISFLVEMILPPKLDEVYGR